MDDVTARALADAEARRDELQVRHQDLRDQTRQLYFQGQEVLQELAQVSGTIRALTPLSPPVEVTNAPPEPPAPGAA